MRNSEYATMTLTTASIATLDDDFENGADPKIVGETFSES